MYPAVKNKGLRIFLTTVSLALAVVVAAAVLLAGVVFLTRLANKGKIAIKTENGIQEEGYVELGGAEQYVQIRGRDKSNPVILFLHGGPGNPLSFLSYYFQYDLEKDFTFVHWDQRGSGKTYFQNPGFDNNDMTFEMLMGDLHELVEHLKERFGKEKIIIMGHSWGTTLGSVYSLRHPENVLAYIGVGQVVSGKGGDLAAADEAIRLAGEKGNTKDAERMEEIRRNYEKAANIDELNVSEWSELRALTSKYLTVEGQMSGMGQIWIGGTSPQMSWRDLRWYLILGDAAGVFAMQKPIMDYAMFEFNIYDIGSEYEVPVYFVTGEGDWVTPLGMSEEYFAVLDAPDKKYVVIKNTGHSPMLDNPEEFQSAIRELLEGVGG